MTIEQKINDIIKKNQEVESQLEEIKKNISEISNKVSHIGNISGGESYLTDYSRNRIIRIESEVQQAIEFLDKDENLNDQVRVERYFNQFSSKLAHLTVIFEIYYVLRITYLMALSNEKYMDLTGLDRSMEGFYIPENSFEELINKKEYDSLKSQLSGIKDRYDEIMNRWVQ